MLASALPLLATPTVQEPNVEVFKTNIGSARHAEVVTAFVQAYFPSLRVTVDLQDCDKVLRVQEPSEALLPVLAIRRLVIALGFEIEQLAD